MERALTPAGLAASVQWRNGSSRNAQVMVEASTTLKVESKGAKAGAL